MQIIAQHSNKMKSNIDPNKHILVSDGGVSFDRRTWAGKDLIKRIKETAAYMNDDINPNFLGLRLKDINLLFTTENINFN
jgi:hypothetical protein